MQESGDGFVHLGGVFGVAFDEVAVLVPLHVGVAVGDLDETDAAFGKAPGHQALVPEVLRHGIVHAVELAGGLGFIRDILQIRHGGLHAEGKFEGVDAGLQGGIGTGDAEMIAVHPAGQV